MRRANESGFALLLVFLMASIVAIGLYYELPRVAMESQRQKEQLLIERGEQYKRAIQLFYKKAGRYPADVKELENFQNLRFLRHRYIDPMTGKDEWRLIHIQNGVLTDSLVTKPKAQGDQAAASTMGSYIGMQAGALDPQAAQGGAANAKDRRRASDGGAPTIGPDGQPLPPQMGPQMGGQSGSAQYPGQPPMPGAQPFPIGNPNPNLPPNVGLVIPGSQPGQNAAPYGAQPVAGQPGQPPGQTPVQGGNPGGSYIGGSQSYIGGGAGTAPVSIPGGFTYPGQTMPGQPNPGQVYPGQPNLGQVNTGQPLQGQFGAPVNTQTGGVSPYPAQGNFGTPAGFPQPGLTTGGAPGANTAADMINRILTSPRPGGMPQGGIGGLTVGSGMAGVASNSAAESVMIYNDRTVYKEWEFIFDQSKVKPIQNPNAAGGTPMGTPASQMGSMPAQSGMTPVGGGPLNSTNPMGTPQQGPRPDR